VIHETEFDDSFYYFGNKRQIRDWPIVDGELSLSNAGFLTTVANDVCPPLCGPQTEKMRRPN